MLRIYIYLGWIYRKLGWLDEAEEVVSEALRIRRATTPSHYHSALTAYTLGEIKREKGEDPDEAL